MCIIEKHTLFNSISRKRNQCSCYSVLFLNLGIADRRNLQPMYDKLGEEIRKYDDEHIILFEAVTWEVTGIGEAIGFTHPPGGFDYSNR